MTKSSITKTLSGICAITALAVLPASGAGSGSINPPSSQGFAPSNEGFPQIKQENPSIKAYNEGVDLMKAKQFVKAQAKFQETLKEKPNCAKPTNNLPFMLAN